MQMRAISLFSGIGGFDLAAEACGITPVVFCEKEKFCQRILQKHWPHVPIINDIHDMKGDEYGTIDIVYGGFPCQPFSVAGKQKGKDDDRYLWAEMLRIIREARPTWVVGENVTGIIKLALDTVLSDLEKEGYSTRTYVLPAYAVGAQHQRNRVWFVSYANGKRVQRRSKGQILGQCDIPQRQISKPFPHLQGRFDTYQSRLCRSLYGLPNGVDRVRALGNAIVPQVAEVLFKNIIEVSE